MVLDADDLSTLATLPPQASYKLTPTQSSAGRAK